jgi:hypothetical protein
MTWDPKAANMVSLGNGRLAEFIVSDDASEGFGHVDVWWGGQCYRATWRQLLTSDTGHLPSELARLLTKAFQESQSR